MNPFKPQEGEGLFGKYIIRKADGTNINPNAKYFVLRYDAMGGAHAQAARLALMRYCTLISGSTLADELTASIQKEQYQL